MNIKLRWYLGFFLLISKSLLSQVIPDDFNFTYRFGLTNQGDPPTYFDSERDSLVVYGIDTVMFFRLQLNREEIALIFNEINRINIFDYPQNYSYHSEKSDTTYTMDPCESYTITIRMNNHSKSVTWNDCIGSRIKDSNLSALMELDHIIQKSIWSKNPLINYHPSRMRL